MFANMPVKKKVSNTNDYNITRESNMENVFRHKEKSGSSLLDWSH